MNAKKTMILGLLVLLLCVVTILVGCGGNDVKPEKALTNFSKVIEKENIDSLRLTIYYINPSILTRAPLSVDGLMNHSAVKKIVIDCNGLKKYTALLNQINVDILIPVKHKSHLNTRLCYVGRLKFQLPPRRGLLVSGGACSFYPPGSSARALAAIQRRRVGRGHGADSPRFKSSLPYSPRPLREAMQS